MPEFRCRHGFLRSVVSCPECDAEQARATGSVARTRGVSDEAIAAAIEATGSGVAAARQLEINEQTVRNRARKSQLIVAALRKARESKAERHLLNGTFECGRCGETKPLSEFYISRKDPRGHQTRCKDCDNKKTQPRGRTAA